MGGGSGSGGGGMRRVEREVLNPKFFVPSSMRTGQYTKLHYLRITISPCAKYTKSKVVCLFHREDRGYWGKTLAFLCALDCRHS